MAAGALGLIPFVVLTLARVLEVDDRSTLAFVLLSVTPVVFLPAYAVLALAAALRAKALAAAAAVVVALHLSWVLPGLRAGSLPPASWPSLDVVAANVLATDTADTEVAAALAGLDADVLVITELTPAQAVELEHGAFSERFPHRIVDARTDAFGSGIYSSLPLIDPQPSTLEELPTVRAAVDVQGTVVDVVAVHTLQPLVGHEREIRQLAELRALVQDRRRPLVLAGDFNATFHHSAFRRVLDAGMTDAHLARGRGLATSWPASWAVGPFVLLDHVLVSEDIGVRSVSEVEVPGSDHLAVKAELAVDPE